MTAPTVAPLAWTSSWPPVSVRSGVGMRTVVSMSLPSKVALVGPVAARVEIRDGPPLAAERAAAPRADGDGAQDAGEAVVGGDGAVRRGVPRERADGAVGREGA